MREYMIKVDPFKFISILDCRINKQINEHAEAEISGYIDEKSVDEYIGIGVSDTWVTISITDEEQKNQDVFCGMIKDLSVSSQGDLNKLTVSLISGTYLMDTVCHTRTFQDVSMSYENLLRSFTSTYQGGSFVMASNTEKNVEELAVQYKETDWEFAKRLATRFNECVIPESTLSGVKYYFGMPSSNNSHEINAIEYSIKKDVKEYINKSTNTVTDISESDEIYYVVESREAYKICDNVSFKGKSLYIYSIYTYLKGNELVHRYQLKSRNGFKVNKIYNDKIIGASLEANIIEVKNDTVKVCVKVDGTQDSSKAKWFPYSTVYSSPDGSGWYCMPEKGDEVRLYFPREKEKLGYIISSVHLAAGGDSAGGTAARSNPDNKSIKSKYGKEVLLSPNSIKVTNNKGMSIEIVDDEGISIISDKAINIKSDESINIASINKELGMIAAESINLSQGENKIILKNDILLTGSQVKMK